ncbi:hypothetical protein QTP88_007535 [Uroleucon formosanum]
MINYFIHEKLCIRLLKLMIFTRQIIYVCFKVHKYIYEYIYILVNRLTITIINKLQLLCLLSVLPEIQNPIFCTSLIYILFAIFLMLLNDRFKSRFQMIMKFKKCKSDIHLHLANHC